MPGADIVLRFFLGAMAVYAGLGLLSAWFPGWHQYAVAVGCLLAAVAQRRLITRGAGASR